MGVDQNAYIGPYVKVIQIVEKRKIDNCAKHNFPADAMYCPKCGIPKSGRFSTEDVIANAPEFWQDEYTKNGKNVNFNDYLSSTSCMGPPPIKNKDGKRTRTYIFIPNRYYKELNIPKIKDGEGEQEISFEALYPAGMLEKFKELFADELAYLKQWFEVEVKFGYVSYYS